MANFPSRTLILLIAILSSHSVSSQTSSCWRFYPNVTFPQSYVIIGDASNPSFVNQVRQILLVYNENIQALNIPKTLVNFTENMEFDSSDVGSDPNSICYSVRHQRGFPPLTTFLIKCRRNETTVEWQAKGSHKVQGSIFVDPSGENVFWRSPKWPGEVHVTSIDRQESMGIFADTKSWADSTTFLIDTRRRLIFWVEFGQSSFSYSNLVAPSEPIATVPTNADAATFNSMTLDFDSGSIYWLVTSAEGDKIYRYNYTGESAATELVVSFDASPIGQRSHLHFFNSTLSLLVKTGDDYRVEVFPLPANTSSSEAETALNCIDRKYPKLIYAYNVFKTEAKREGLSCKGLNCSHICLDGPKPQCLCPRANTTLTGPDSNVCVDIEIELLQEPMDNNNGTILWTEENLIIVRSILFNKSLASAKAISTFVGLVTVQFDKAHRTVMFISTTGSAIVVRYDNPVQFQTRTVHPNDGINRSNFKYYCQRLYWIESNSAGNDVLKSYYFVNGQAGTVQDVDNGTQAYMIQSNAQVDCGPIEIHPVPLREPLMTSAGVPEFAEELQSRDSTPKAQDETGSVDPVLMHHVQQLCQLYSSKNHA